MKIVNRKAFLALPAGTVFAKYQPCIFEDMRIKGDTLATDDFLYQSIVDAVACTDSGDFTARLDDSETNGTSVPMDFECMGRDGCFDADQLFAVFEPGDVKDLVARLMVALVESSR